MNLINGDCLEKLKEIPDNSIDLVFADLPYGQTSCKWDCKIDLKLLWTELKRVCKNKKKHGKATPLFFTTTTKFGVELINSNRKWFRYDLVWVKSAPCGFLSARKMPLRKHEMVYVFYENLPFYDLSSHKHKFKTIKTQALKNTIYGFNGSLGYKKGKIGCYTPSLPTSILEIKSKKGKHRTQKPVDLMKWILKYYSKEGDTILDPTMGSGSMGVACKEMNRNFIGIEKDNEIFKMAETRCK